LSIVVMETIDCHAWLSSFDGTPGAALPNRYLYTSYISAIHAIMSQYLQVLLFAIQPENTRPLSATQMDGLSADNLKNFVQVQRRGDDRRAAVNGCQLVHLTP